jgi:probable phosphoglycerate mutase
MRLILVRHGEAYAGLHGTIAGPRGCAGLTDHGRRQAEALRDHLLVDPGHLSADILVASVLPRAIETAQIIAPGLGFEEFAQDCDLCEVHTGEADGTDWADYAERFGTLDMLAEPDRLFAPGGDSWNSFHESSRSRMGPVSTYGRPRTPPCTIELSRARRDSSFAFTMSW